jgi:diguanylate cyclase (GGDEF)-like protein/PAS domain S-box-containing protein
LYAQASIASVLRVTLGLVLLYAAVGRSATESERLRENFRRMTEMSHQGVAVIRGERMLYANPALLRIYGLDRLEDAPVNWRDATMPTEERAVGRERHRRILAGELAHAEWEGQRYRPDGTPLRLRFSAWRTDWNGEPAEQAVVSDDTAHHDTLRTLLHQATHDELTGLPNRSALLQRLRELCGSEASGEFALLLLDVDRFKLFNEAHGPSLGDAVLKALATGLATALDGQAEVMRLGEDEFALLAHAADGEATAQHLATAVRDFVARPLALDRASFYLDLSMGVALYPATAREPEALLRAANAAMHEAKRTPGTSVQFAEKRFEHGSGNALDIEQALRAGLTNDEFSLVYQPKVDARSGGLVGFEALARWERPGFASVGPDEFIAAAERTGMIGKLGEIVLVCACEQLAQWSALSVRMVPVAVNVSPLQLLDPDFPDLVVRTLHRFGLPPSLLTLELTESAAVTHMGQAREQIGRLRGQGVETALDDFGTGFSSLNMLRSLPLKMVKIDRSLIAPLPAPDASAVIRAICDLARVLRLDVVAEGIETADQRDAALRAGCRVMQGDFYASPLAPADATLRLRAASEFQFESELPVEVGG